MPDPVQPTALIALLSRFGYLGDRLRPSEPELADAAERYRIFHDLGRGTSVAEHIALPRCGTEDVRPLGLLRPPCQWPAGHVVRVDFGFRVGGLSDKQVADAFHWALRRWQAASGFRWRLDASTPNIVSRAGRIDGYGNILAWSGMPLGAAPDTVLRQTYDSKDSLLTQSLPFFRAVVLHELGHALGLDHSADRRSIMYPVMRPDVLDLGYGDIEQIRLKYPRAA